MKRCKSCGQLASQKVTICPGCGSRLVDGIKTIDDYNILAIIHEGRSSIVCKAVKDGGKQPVSIRIFTKDSGVDDQVAQRLVKELEVLKKLPADHFVQHFAMKKSKEGHWYRVSEWVNASDWGSVFMSGLLNDQRRIVTLFRNIASVLDLLNKQDHFMPYLILDDILIPREKTKRLSVKINYKLSRFLNARATHHGPMLKKLLECHPDITNGRAIDFKTGIWSLGKIFIELLTADHNLKNFSSKVDELKGLHPDLKVLIKIMLADDPDLRPKSMGQVSDALSRILDTMSYNDSSVSVYSKRGSKLASEMQRLKKAVMFLTTLFVVVAAVGSMSWLYFNFDKTPQKAALSDFVESYTSSVAFLMVEYWLTDEENNQVVYRNKVEGTAFLVDPDGYLLTNRHVACPWLEDTSLFQAYHQVSMVKKAVVFDYKMYLWFEGSKAFKRLPALSDSTEISDLYHLSSAYISGGEGNLRIAGVPRTSTKTGELIKAPFKNDFAVLKIDTLPSDLKPIPLETTIAQETIKRLDPVIILGFPLGNRTQANHINTSITRGHVRRTSKEIIQVDSSIYKGNSGGPAINSNGKVIGIASGVITDQISKYFKVTTPLSDFGLILPIIQPVHFIESLKKGHPQWDGILDFSLESKLEQITSLAVENKFKEAADLSEAMLQSSNAPALFYAAGMMNFCTLDFDASRHYFEKLIRLEQKNATSLLMLYIIDWIKSQKQQTRLTNSIFKMTRYDEDEFLGYLAHVLKEEKSMNPEFIDYENQTEKSWRLFIEGLIAEKKIHLTYAQKIFKKSILNAGINDWVYYLAFSRLNHIQESLAAYQENKKVFKEQIVEFKKRARENRKFTAENRNAMTLLIQEFESAQTNHEEKIAAYTQLLEVSPENRTIYGRVAFYHATNNEWDKALDFIDIYFKQPCRETGLSLSLNLLKGEILKIIDRPVDARKHLNAVLKQTRDPWYRIIIKQLLSKPDESVLKKLAGTKPEKLITMHTALGLWAEGDKNYKQATHHYREALSSYLDSWNEYDFALGRIKQLRKTN